MTARTDIVSFAVEAFATTTRRKCEIAWPRISRCARLDHVHACHIRSNNLLFMYTCLTCLFRRYLLRLLQLINTQEQAWTSCFDQTGAGGGGQYHERSQAHNHSSFFRISTSGLLYRWCLLLRGPVNLVFP